jgi:hypothetical protein
VGYDGRISGIFTPSWPWCNNQPRLLFDRMIPPPMPRKPKEPDPRVILPIPPKLLREIDDYRWQNRIPSRAEAIRLLVKEGLRLKK